MTAKIKGSGAVKASIKTIKESEKGYRTIYCPDCGSMFKGKFFREVIACSRCGYRKKNHEYTKPVQEEEAA